MLESEIAKYHLPTSCDLAAHNHYRHDLVRNDAHRRLLPTGIGRVPNTKTILCPKTPLPNLHRDSSLIGFDVVSIFENRASTPIVVSFVREDDGIEYSANDPKITP